MNEKLNLIVEAMQEIDEHIATGHYEKGRLLLADIRTLLEVAVAEEEETQR